MSGLGTDPIRCLEIQAQVLGTARHADYAGYSKHDALNAPWMETLAGRSRLLRLAFIQLVSRCPVHIRPWLGVRVARNAKGLALFARALLSRYRLLHREEDALEARGLLEWLITHSSPGFAWTCWGYPYPWQDVGFFADRDFPNRVVTAFVAQALLDGYETLRDERFLDAAGDAIRFLIHAPKTLYEDARHRCVSYVPSNLITWIVMDVSALVGAVTARFAARQNDDELMEEAGRLVRYVACKQTDEGAWFYADPPSTSHIAHDNYHTGFILDSLLLYAESAKSTEFDHAYQQGLRFYEKRLFEKNGAPRFMSDRRYPFDIHGCAQGIITFSLSQRIRGEGGHMARRVLAWTLANMYDPRSGWFYYQKRRAFRTRIRELRWCQAWMSWALASFSESARDTA